ncbi:MAG: tetratricopeptide repeat protein [Polyangiales bacterium]
MATPEPYSVELTVRHLPTAPEGVVELVLDDRQVSGRVTVAPARLRFDEPALRDIAATFLRGDVLRHAEGLAYGRALAARLFAPDGLGPVWATLQHDRGARPLRLVLTLPATEAGRVAIDEIPFELLADEGDGGFWFRRPGWSLVRAFEGVPGVRYALPMKSRALLAWANPSLPDDLGNAHTLPAAVFDAHEEAFAREAGALGCAVRPHLGRATADGLAAALRDRPETPLLSLVAHGDPRGGALVLHADDGGDEGRGLLAHDLAKRCRDGGVKVTLLWSCHGARRHVDRSSVAAALLDPAHGDGAAVVASHAALVADRTARLVGPLLRSLRDVAEGDLERALAEARHALDGDDLQWAAPVYYARPLEGRSVTVEASIERYLAERVARGPERVEGAPEPKPWFRGRDEDLTRVLAFVKGHRLTTLTGGAGIGKTTLAAEAARRAIADASIGLARAVWLDLSSQRAMDTLREALALVFDLDPARCGTDLALAKALGASRALAVLDNAEELLRADGEGLRALLDTVLRHAPGLRVLMTSRRALGDLDGVQEQRYAVDRLPEGVDREVFVAVAGAKLGADAARSEVGELLRALAGHPQSIVLVAGQVGRGLTLTELVARVKAEDPDVVRDAGLLDDEVEETSDARLRARRLVSSLNLSFHPLVAGAPVAAEMFAWLGIFPGGLPEVLVTGVFGEDAKRHLGRLLAHNMVERRGADDRITLAGPVRWYARAQQRAAVAGREVIAAPRREELTARSAAVMEGWLDALARSTGKPGAASACARAKEDGDTLETLATCLRDMDDREPLAARVGAAFYAFSHLARYGAYHREAEATGERMRGALREVGARRGLAEVLYALGELYVRTARLVEGEHAYGEALTIYRVIEARLGEANTLRALGDLYVRTARLVEAEGAYEDALPIYRAIDARLGEAETLHALGDLYVRTARLVEAEGAYEEAMPIYRAIDARLGEANTRKALGDLYVRTARLVEAEGAYEDALPIQRAIEDRLGEANTLRALGDLYVRTARLVEADGAYEDALRIYRAIEERLGEANTLLALGDLYVRTNRLVEAEGAYGEALPIYRAIDARLGEANMLRALATLSLARGAPHVAFSQYLEVLQLQQAIDDQLGLGGTHIWLTRAANAASRFERAIVLGCRAFAVLRRIDDRFGQMLVASDLLHALDHLRDLATGAITALIWALARSIDDPLAQQCEPFLREMDLDPDTLSPDEILPEALAALDDLSTRYERILRERNEDPYSPLDPAP